MEYNFYGWKRAADIKPVSNAYPKVSSLLELYNILSHIWCADTCAPRMRDKWTVENKTLGQCSITAFLIQDIFGGKVFGIPREGGNYHCYNVINDICFDLTSEQFGDEVKTFAYKNDPEQFREDHFQKQEKKERYEYLKRKLSEYN